MSLFEKGLSLSQNVDRLCFFKNAPLRNEFDELYKSLFNNPNRHITIVEVLSTKLCGLRREEILDIGNLQSNGHLTLALNDLEQSDFISKNHDTIKRKSGVYFFLTDPFTLFYLRYMKNNETEDEYYWTNNMDSGSHNAWRGYAFELLCRMHIRQVKKALGISGVSTTTSSWRSKASNPGAQIDLVIRRKDGITNLCEMKYTKHPYEITKSYSDILSNKKMAFYLETGINSGVHLTMITSFGLAKKGYFGTVQSEITLDDLFDGSR